MYEIKNISEEWLEIVTTIDKDAAGCRLKPVEMPARALAPGQIECTLGYEPGVSIVVRPQKDHDKPRAWPFNSNA